MFIYIRPGSLSQSVFFFINANISVIKKRLKLYFFPLQTFATEKMTTNRKLGITFKNWIKTQRVTFYTGNAP
jgi:hypothetical protein